MALNLLEKDGQTPLEKDEIDGIIPSHITTQGELDEWEHMNIQAAFVWLDDKLHGMKSEDVLDDLFCRNLHQRMFCDTWKWAGRYRLSDKNIGCDNRQVAVNLRNLFEDVKCWLLFKTYQDIQIAARFHHKLVSIHPFPNGNGRHARMMTDALLISIDLKAFSWGSGNLVSTGEIRSKYIASLRSADKGNYDELMNFVQD